MCGPIRLHLPWSSQASGELLILSSCSGGGGGGGGLSSDDINKIIKHVQHAPQPMVLTRKPKYSLG